VFVIVDVFVGVTDAPEVCVTVGVDVTVGVTVGVTEEVGV